MHCPYISDTNEIQYNTPHKNLLQIGAGNPIYLENQISKDTSQRSDVCLIIQKQQSTYEKDFFLCLLQHITLSEMEVLCTVCVTSRYYIELREE